MRSQKRRIQRQVRWSIRTSDDDMDEVKEKQVDVGAGDQVGKEETNLADEMVCDLGMKIWKHRTVEGKKISAGRWH